MNPLVDASIIADAYEEDPQRAAAEYGAEFRSDLEGYVSKEIIDACTIQGRHELPWFPGTAYRAFTDPSGGSGSDSFTIAVAHPAGNHIVLDAVRERRPPFSPDGVVEEFSNLLKSYHLSEVYGDRYAGEWPRERFGAHGIAYRTSEKTKSELYLECLPLLNASRVELLDNPRLQS